MKKSILKKLKSRQGFSLTELLVTIIIMTLVTAMSVGILNMAKKTYEKQVDDSNAQVLMSTILAELRNELGNASEVEANGSTLSFKSVSRMNSAEIICDSKNGIGINYYSEVTEGEGSGIDENATVRFFTTQASGGNELRAVYGGISYDPSTKTVTVSDIAVTKAAVGQSHEVSDDCKALASLDEYIISVQ